MQLHTYGNLQHTVGSMPNQRNPSSVSSADNHSVSHKDSPSVKSSETADVVGRHSVEVAMPTSVVFPVHNKMTNFQLFKTARPHMRAFHYCESSCQLRIVSLFQLCFLLCFSCSFTALGDRMRSSIFPGLQRS